MRPNLATTALVTTALVVTAIGCSVGDLPADSPTDPNAAGSGGAAGASAGSGGASGGKAGTGGAGASGAGTAGTSGGGGKAGTGGAGAGGAGTGGAGASGGSSGKGGAGTGGAGTGGAGSGGAGSAGSAGSAGTGSAGAAGSAGSAGAAGGSGTAGAAGSSGSAGSGGASGNAGSGGASGNAGAGGSAGTAGSAGAGGTGGAAGSAGAAGDAGASGSGGDAGSAGSAGYPIGGDVKNLESGTVTLTNKTTGETLDVAADMAFTFTTQAPPGGAYDVVVSAQPAGRYCYVKRGAGVANAAVTNIAVGCSVGGLFGIYPLDGDANDASGNAHHFVPFAGSNSWATDRFGRASHASAPIAGFEHQVPTPQAYTVSAWVRISTLAFGAAFVGRSHTTLTGNSSNNMELHKDGHFFHYVYWDGGGLDVLGKQVATVDTWYHVVIAARMPNVQSRLYVNGVLDGSADTGCCNYDTAGVNRWAIFGSAQSGTQIDDLRIYESFLSDADVAQIYDAEKP